MKNFFLYILLFPLTLCSQNTIQGVFSPVEDFTYAFLYHATPLGSNYVDRAKLEPDGSFTIALDSTAKTGMYKIVYALPPEENNFDFIYNGKEDISFTFNLENGIEFIASNENKLWSSYIKSMELINITISNFYAKESTDETIFNDIFKTLSETQIGYEEASKGTLASTFIKANTPYIPEGFEDLKTYSKHIKQSYLTHVDFNNNLLQSSDFLIERVMAYVFGMTINTSNDIYKKDIDTLVNSIGNQPTVKLSLLQSIWQRFTDLNNEELANYITDSYLLELAKQNNFQPLVEALTVYKNNSLGQIAQNFDIPIVIDGVSKTTTLHDLELANQYLVIFWSSTCGHCLEELPKVKTLVAAKKDLKIIAIGLEDDTYNWQNEILKYPDFIHVLGLGKWDNSIVNAYGVKATPSYFILDQNKVIISKPEDYEALEKVLNKKSQL